MPHKACYWFLFTFVDPLMHSSIHLLTHSHSLTHSDIDSLFVRLLQSGPLFLVVRDLPRIRLSPPIHSCCPPPRQRYMIDQYALRSY